MAFGALYVLVLEGKRVLRVLVMREQFLGLFPVLYVVARLALLGELALMLVLVAYFFKMFIKPYEKIVPVNNFAVLFAFEVFVFFIVGEIVHNNNIFISQFVEP